MAPLALGTQTAGSIIRPASFCGVVGYKPSYGAIGRAGLKLLAESLDTVCVFARDAALFVGALTARDELLELPAVSGPLRIGMCRTHEWSHVEAATAQGQPPANAADLIRTDAEKYTPDGAAAMAIQPA